MFGTWHPTRSDNSRTDNSPSARLWSTHNRLGSASALATTAERCRVTSNSPASSMGELYKQLRKDASREADFELPRAAPAGVGFSVR